MAGDELADPIVMPTRGECIVCRHEAKTPARLPACAELVAVRQPAVEIEVEATRLNISNGSGRQRGGNLKLRVQAGPEHEDGFSGPLIHVDLEGRFVRKVERVRRRRRRCALHLLSGLFPAFSILTANVARGAASRPLTSSVCTTTHAR